MERVEPAVPHDDDTCGYLTTAVPAPYQVPPRWAVGGAELGEELAKEHVDTPENEGSGCRKGRSWMQEGEGRMQEGEIAGFGRPSQEALMGMIAGMAYGAASPLAGHPIDTIKTKLQADPAHRSCSSLMVLRHVLRREGVLGLYRGVTPAVLGGTIYGGIVLSVYSGSFASCNGTMLAEPIPFTGGLRGSVLVAAVASGGARSLVETPLAFMKVRRQTGSDWRIERGAGVSLASHCLRQGRELYIGSTPTLYRSCTMLGAFFVLNDYCSRLLPTLNSMVILGPFVQGGVCASVGWIAAWPFEVVKSRVQADTVRVYHRMSVPAILARIVREEGARALFRGILPGLSKSFVSNGAAMIALHFTQRSLRVG
jgi:solute carrier family 25 carnitine/acylcarnitine transporter 20/29